MHPHVMGIESLAANRTSLTPKHAWRSLSILRAVVTDMFIEALFGAHFSTKMTRPPFVFGIVSFVTRACRRHRDFYTS